MSPSVAARPLAIALSLACLLRLPFTANAKARARAPHCNATEIFERVRAATGADRWDAVRQLTALGRVTISSLSGTARLDADLEGGRHAERFSVPVMGSSAQVFDGATLWAQDVSGGVHPLDSEFAHALALTDAYLARHGYFALDDAATKVCVGKTSAGRDSSVVVRVTPPEGRPADITIGTVSLRVLSVRETLPTTQRIVRYGDYRRVGGLLLPFSIRTGTLAEPSDSVVVRVARYRLEPSVRADDFVPPAPTAVASLGLGLRATTIPLQLEAQQLFVSASINGHKPMPFLLDSGGHAILTTQAARALGLRSSGAGESGGSGPGTIGLGFTHVKSVRIGDARLRDQPFLVIPYPYSFYERGPRQPLAGILGLEIFERFAVRIDYGARKVTLTKPAAFGYDGHTAPLPITFTEDEPLVPAAADGHRADFGVDTGNSGSLILFGPFLFSRGITTRYGPGLPMQGRGTGGTNTGTQQTLRRFSLGGHELRSVRTYFAHMTQGAFASTTEGGNIGFETLSRFVPTFDYARQRLYLDPSPHPPVLLKERAGLRFFKSGPDAFDVVSVRPGSAAAGAHITAGDSITAVDGIAAANYSRSDLFEIVRQPAGTRLPLTVKHGHTSRDVVLVLK